MWKLYNNYPKYSGNNTTINRLSFLLKLPITKNIKNFLIGIHLYKFGSLVINQNLIFGVIVGGTDIYQNFPIDIIKQTLIEAKFIICFNNYMKINLIQYGDFNDKIFLIPQSVHPKINLFLLNQNVFNDIYLKKKYEKVFLFLGNLRPIKDPFYLKNIFDYLYQTKGYLLVFIGDIGEYNIDSFDNGYFYYGTLPYKLALSQIKYCDGLINSSINEGMSNSILEALYMGCPVFARSNEGNNSIKNIFLYDDPLELIELLQKPTKKQSINGIIDNVLTYHSFTEKYLYQKIFKNI